MTSHLLSCTQFPFENGSTLKGKTFAPVISNVPNKLEFYFF